MQGLDQWLRQHDDAVLAALALAHDENLAIEVHVLYAESQSFHQPEAGAVQQCDEQCERRFHVIEELRNLRPGQHDWNSHRSFRPADLLHPRQLDIQHLPIEEEQGSQRLFVSGRGDVPFGRQVREKGFDLRRPQRPRML